MSAGTGTAQGVSLLTRVGRGGTVTMLGLVLFFAFAAGWSAFLLGDQLFNVGALQSMAFQLPELGILSLAMMVALLSGGLNLSIIATANLCALTMAWVLTHYVRRARTASCGVDGRSSPCSLASPSPPPSASSTHALHHRLPRRFADPRNPRHHDTLQGTRDRPDTRQCHLRLPPTRSCSSAMARSGVSVPVAMVIFLALCAPVALLLNKSPFGHKIYMIGSNEKATRFSGVDTRRVVLKIYALSRALLGGRGGAR